MIHYLRIQLNKGKCDTNYKNKNGNNELSINTEHHK